MTAELRVIADLANQPTLERATIAQQLRDRAESYMQDAAAMRNRSVTIDNPDIWAAAYEAFATDLRRIAREVTR